MFKSPEKKFKNIYIFENWQKKKEREKGRNISAKEREKLIA